MKLLKKSYYNIQIINIKEIFMYGYKRKSIEPLIKTQDYWGSIG